MGFTSLAPISFSWHLKGPLYHIPRIKDFSCECKVFEEITQRNNLFVVAKGSEDEFRKRAYFDLVVDSLSNCTREGNVAAGKKLHASFIKGGICGDKIVDTALVNLYAKCGEIDSAILVFDGMVSVDVAACNCLLSGFLSNGMFKRAVSLFIKMTDWGIIPNHYTFSILISGCGSILAMEEGAQFHAHVVKLNYELTVVVGNSLLTMYCKFGFMEDAQRLFQTLPEKNIVSCTALISGLYQKKAFEEALWQLHLMREEHGFQPNEHTFTLALSCCGGMRHSDNGYALHAHLIKNGMVSGAFVGTAIVDMYTELGEMADAEKHCREMGRNASVVSWNALLAGFVRKERFGSALEAFQNMVVDRISCDEYTLSSVLKASASLPSSSSTRQLHSYGMKSSLVKNLHVASSLIEAYTSCGNLDEAEKVFDQIVSLDIVAWNSMVKAYSQHGCFRKAIALFEKMASEGQHPNSSTFLAVLSACSHCGLVEEGKAFFESMLMGYKIMPEETHYSSMVDLFSRSGELEEALAFIERLPISPSALIWRPFLAGCCYYGNLKLGELAANRILELEPNDASVYVTLSNMYSKVGRVSEAEEQRKVMALKEVKKEPGFSWLEVKGKMHKFFSGDRSHPQTTQIYSFLQKLMRGTDSSDSRVLYHSEKIAVSFGLLNLPHRVPIRVFKNLRVCSDCHSAMKNISKITEREIVLRDNYRFHHFKKGSCSCGDFW